MSKKFRKIIDDIYLLETPLGDIWSGIVLVDGEEKILIDSGEKAQTVDEYLIPALAELGYTLNDITYLCNTHSHGDHVGGNYRIKELSKVKVATYSMAVPKVREPLKYSKLIRAAYPDFSPAPPPVLLGVEPDLILEDGDLVGNRLQVIAAPGHDTDSVCFYDKKTRTLITGDSFQGNGASVQGLALYMNLSQYRETLKRMKKIDIENIVSGHPYLFSGDCALGKEESLKYISRCEEIIEIYGAYIKEQVNMGITNVATIAEGLIMHMNNHKPSFLFQALYTVDAHLREME